MAQEAVQHGAAGQAEDERGQAQVRVEHLRLEEPQRPEPLLAAPDREVRAEPVVEPGLAPEPQKERRHEQHHPEPAEPQDSQLVLEHAAGQQELARAGSQILGNCHIECEKP